MTYFGFLFIFLVIPILLLVLAIRTRPRSGVGQAGLSASHRALVVATGVQVMLAVLYTTPWDNYLVATGVWNYGSAAVTGILLGYVPIEEYTFFVLEAILVGAWWRFANRGIRPREAFRATPGSRLWAAGITTAVWLASLAMLLSGWTPGIYLSLILVWALPPLTIQVVYGADILWHHRRLVGSVIIPLGLYLSLADSVALGAGIWAISPYQSTGILLGTLPIEEALFFFATVILLTFGLTLSLADESRSRLRAMLSALREHLPPVAH
jgi:lycopene cyclase domain-containing protein